MSETPGFPVALAAAPFDPEGKTVAEVVGHVSRALHATENEPEWITHANFIDDENVDWFGLRATAPWPHVRSRRRMILSVERGTSEGWIIHVDSVEFIVNNFDEFWKSIPVMRIKALSRSQAWSIAAVVSRMLDID